jgi:hypothetical protein
MRPRYDRAQEIANDGEDCIFSLRATKVSDDPTEVGSLSSSHLFPQSPDHIYKLLKRNGTQPSTLGGFGLFVREDKFVSCLLKTSSNLEMRGRQNLVTPEESTAWLETVPYVDLVLRYLLIHFMARDPLLEL